MHKNFFCLCSLFLGLLLPSTLHAEEGYFSSAGRNLVRGLKNVISSPLEIPITIQEYHESSGRPFVRHMAGFADGTFQMFERMGSGVWDYVVAFIPSIQEGLPPTPETLF